jgi:pyruvate kinase
MGKPVAILQDLCGPKIRTGKTGPTHVANGDLIDMISGSAGDEKTIAVEYEGLHEDVRPDDRILLSDGQVELRVVRVKGERVEVRVEHGGPMRARMGVNLPSGSLRLGALTEKDKLDLDFGLSMGVDYVALSFVRRAEEVEELREICRPPSSRRSRRPLPSSASTRSCAPPTRPWSLAAISASSSRRRPCP